MGDSCEATAATENLFSPVSISVFKSRAFRGIPTEVPTYDWKKGDVSRLASLCMGQEAMLRAAKLAEVISNDVSMRCVYVITTPELPVCKIGVCVQPLARLSQLQVGNWNRLHVAGLLWVVAKGHVLDIEKAAHKAADEMGCWLSGEWVSMTPIEAMELVVKAARHTNAGVADSERWMDGLAMRVSAVLKSNRPEFARAA